jgi:hypothetical protein
VNHVAIEVDGLAVDLSKAVPPLALDLEIVEKIQATQRPPTSSQGLRGFAREWDARRVRRIAELEQAGVIRREPGGTYLVASGWDRRLDRFRFASIYKARREAARILSRASPRTPVNSARFSSPHPAAETRLTRAQRSSCTRVQSGIRGLHLKIVRRS